MPFSRGRNNRRGTPGRGEAQFRRDDISPMDVAERGPRRGNARRKGRSKSYKRGSAKQRSRDFLEGQLFERDRMDGYREPIGSEEGNYGDSPRRQSLRIGYRV